MSSTTLDALAKADITAAMEAMSVMKGGDDLASIITNLWFKGYESGLSRRPPGHIASSVLIEIAAERHQQFDTEGRTSTYFATNHKGRQLARAAACYADHYVGRSWLLEKMRDGLLRYQEEQAPDEWPFTPRYWKPRSPRQDLILAAALLLAEIEQFDKKGGD